MRRRYTRYPDGVTWAERLHAGGVLWHYMANDAAGRNAHVTASTLKYAKIKWRRATLMMEECQGRNPGVVVCEYHEGTIGDANEIRSLSWYIGIHPDVVVIARASAAFRAQAEGLEVAGDRLLLDEGLPPRVLVLATPAKIEGEGGDK